MVVIALLFLLAPPAARGEEGPLDMTPRPFPETFAGTREARRYGCHPASLRGIGRRNCFLTEYDGYERRLSVAIYDQEDGGEWIRMEQFCLPSWHGSAHIKARDILGSGQDFLVGEFEGNTGTGVLQNLLVMLGWFDGRWTVPLLETSSYSIAQPGRDASLNLRIVPFGKASRMAVRLDYDYREFLPPRRVRESWTENHFWDAKNLSFYDFAQEEDRVRSGNLIQAALARVRLLTKGLDTKGLCSGLLNHEEVFSILP